MKIIQDLVPKWVYRKNLNAVIVMSNDLDSLISCCMYSYLTGYPIGYFYDFETMSAIHPKDMRERIYIDIAIKKGKCIDNHVMRFTLYSKVNMEAVNFNSIYEISSDNYYDKFAMSTLIILYAIFKDELPLPKSELGKMMILAIDSGYLGFYDNRYKEAFLRNLKALGLEELLEVLERHSLSEFQSITKRIKGHKFEQFERCFITDKLQFSYSEEHNRKANKFLNKLSLLLGFPIALPNEGFEVTQQFHLCYKDAREVEDLMSNPRVYTYAFTAKNKIAVSLMQSKDMRAGA